jgi:superfamily II DNA or RNA helicase
MVKYRIAASTSKIPKDAASLENLAALKTFERNRFLASLKSKTQLAKMCIDKMNNGVKRILVFTGSIEQCNELLGANVYHSKSTNTAYEAFNRKEINILGAVKAIDEGVNIVDLDQSLIVSYDSSSRRLVQRIGRNLRHGLDGKALIYILCTMDTAEEKWLETILEAFDRNKIKYYSSKSITAQTA